MKLSDQITHVVRGEIHWSSLQNLGVSLRKESDRWVWYIPPLSVAPVEVTITDLRTALLNLRTKSGELREWASFLVAASDLVALHQLERLPHGEFLLNALWNLSFGKDADKELDRIALAIQNQN